MRRAGLVALVLFSTVPALGMMPPWVYEEARTNAADVIVVSVSNVQVPTENMGNCTVEGTVYLVERGTRYANGDPVRLSVDCLGEFDSDVPIGGVIWQDKESLAASRFGRAFLDESGNIALYQYEQLTESELPKVKRRPAAPR